jgi:hypothetical protein
MTLGTRSGPVAAVVAPRVEPTVAREAAPQLAEPWLGRGGNGLPAPPVEALARLAPHATTPPTTAPAPPPPATATGDPDSAYRNLIKRVREEREQLGDLISHPF